MAAEESDDRRPSPAPGLSPALPPSSLGITSHSEQLPPPPQAPPAPMLPYPTYSAPEGTPLAYIPTPGQTTRVQPGSYPAYQPVPPPEQPITTSQSQMSPPVANSTYSPYQSRLAAPSSQILPTPPPANIFSQTSPPNAGQYPTYLSPPPAQSYASVANQQPYAPSYQSPYTQVSAPGPPASSFYPPPPRQSGTQGASFADYNTPSYQYTSPPNDTTTASDLPWEQVLQNTQPATNYGYSPAYGVGPPPAPTQPTFATFDNTAEDQPHDIPAILPIPTTRFKGDTLGVVTIVDGEETQFIETARPLKHYLDLYPEAENDQACRLFAYGPNCPTELLMALFQHYDFPRFSLFPYALKGDFSIPDQFRSGSCMCDKCMKGDLCGHHVIFKNLKFYMHIDTKTAKGKSAKVSTTDEKFISISDGITEYNFQQSDWNIQVFRFRTRRNQTAEYAYDALVYQDYKNTPRLRSSPLDYLFLQLDLILENWEVIINAGVVFLASFRLEILEERLETDRSIVRNLLVAAQHWEMFRRMLQQQAQSIEFLRQITMEPRWMKGRDDHFGVQIQASGFLNRFSNITLRINKELQEETDTLIQRVTNLITIDEGYRSRDQNTSIWRLTWVTVIFLPLVFTAGLFGMNVDLFKNDPSWAYYVYTSIVVVVLLIVCYGFVRSRRFRRLLKLTFGLFLFVSWLFHWSLRMMFKRRFEPPPFRGPRGLDVSHDPEKGPIDSTAKPKTDTEAADMPTVIKWAACAGRTDLIYDIMGSHGSSKPVDLNKLGDALVSTAQNGHIEAALLLIKRGCPLNAMDDKRNTVLHHAARLAMDTVVKALLEGGANSDLRNVYEQTPLDLAMETNHDATINLLLKRKGNQQKQSTSDLRSLHFSARTGDLETLRELHEAGSTFESRDGKGQTVIFHAIKGKQKVVLKYLLQQKANPRAIDREGQTPLHIAAQVCDDEAATLLVEAGVTVDALSVKNMTPLMCIPGPAGLSMLKLLHSHGANLNAQSTGAERLSHIIATLGDEGLPVLQVLRDLGADLSSSGPTGNTPAHIAAGVGSVRALQLLSNSGCDVRNPQNIDGHTPLMYACSRGSVSTARYLLANGASSDVIDNNSTTLKELAIRWGNPEILQVLREHGVNFSEYPDGSNVRDVGGAHSTAHPIWKAVAEGQVSPVRHILDDGFSTEYRFDGVSLLQLALEVGNHLVVDLLIDRGASVTFTDEFGWTPLHSAAFRGDNANVLKILQKLTGYDVYDPNTSLPLDNQMWTPLDLAKFYGHEDVVFTMDPRGVVTEWAWEREEAVRAKYKTYSAPLVLSESTMAAKVELA